MNINHLKFPLNSSLQGFSRIRSYLITVAGVLTWVTTSGRRLLVAMRPVITNVTAVTEDVITTLPDLDETLVITAAGTLAELDIVLPAATDSQLGQVKRFVINRAITALTISVAGSGSVTGAALTAGVINTPYAFQCVSTSGAGVWMRIQ